MTKDKKLRDQHVRTALEVVPIEDVVLQTTISERGEEELWIIYQAT